MLKDPLSQKEKVKALEVRVENNCGLWWNLRLDFLTIDCVQALGRDAGRERVHLSLECRGNNYFIGLFQK